MLLLTDEKITKLVAEIGHAVHRETLPIPHFKFREADVPGGHNPELDDSDWQDFCVGDTWGGYDKIAWFRTTVPIPPHLQGRKLALRFLVGPRDGGESTAESLLYVNGQALQGIDIWHPEACLHPEHTTLDRLSVALRAWSGVLGVPDRRRFKVAELVCIDERAERYYHLADTLRKALAELNENDWRRVRLQDAVNRSLSFVDFSRPRSESYYCSMDQALHYLQTEVEDMRTHEPNKPTVVGVGHSHIDMAWLWRLQHTRDKAARTFSTVLNLMRQYPEYRFLHTSPQLFKYLSNDHPELFARVRDKVASGEFEITGGMWIEADTNLPSGESLIRQLLYGKRYLRDVFGVDSKVVWLPDVFGYSWALPQILRGCGMETFMTTKISWSQFNRFPHDTFRWRGLDGSEILTHFMTTPESGSNAYTYNGEFQPKDILGSWTNYQDKTINDELLLAFGWGDGGGGPTREMLETGRVLQNLPGFPKVEFGKAEPYFARLQERLADRDVPVWDGELYLEYHRGTYTSQAQVKRDNRKAEQLLHELEWLASLADVLTGESAYPKLQDTWELLLLNQFHDILPGSSIREVYEDSARDFECIRDHGYDALDAARQRILERLPLTTDSLVVFNSLSWARDELASVPWPAELREFVPGDTSGQPLPSQIVEEDGQQRLLVRVPNVPALGYRALPLVSAGRPHSGSLKMADNLLENDHYRIQLNERGQITSLHDKHNNRDVIPTGSRANLFQVFEDKPLKFDAWDIDFFYQEKSQEISELLEAVVEEAGPLRGVLRLRWRYRDSTLTQRLTLYASTPRIDFRTEVDWHERQVLLKVAFPTTVRSTRATYDIQFGNIERPTHWNTSWDWARFEVTGHKWADLSEGNYGVALLSDCKYGFDIKDHVMRMTLIKSAIRPDPEADQGRHLFTYSLLPHAGTWRESDVVRQGYALNLPLRAAVAPKVEGGPLPASFALAELDAEHVIVETVKRAEDGEAWVVRVYESKHYRNDAVTLRFGKPLRKVVACDLIEEDEQPMPFDGRSLTFAIAPYQIRTFKMWFQA